MQTSRLFVYTQTVAKFRQQNDNSSQTSMYDFFFFSLLSCTCSPIYKVVCSKRTKNEPKFPFNFKLLSEGAKIIVTELPSLKKVYWSLGNLDINEMNNGITIQSSPKVP